MKIDITEILNGRKSRLEFAYDFDETALAGQDYALLPPDVKLKENGIRVTGVVTDVNGYVTLRARVRAEYTAACGRCLEELDRSCEFDLERIVRSGSALSRADVRSDDGDEWDGVTEDLLYVADSAICPDADIMETLALNLPLLHLCDENCQGLCPVCGKKRKDGACSCLEDEKSKKEIDPRLAKLKKLLENPENV